jgi:FkbM family methyltransferase
MLCCRSNIQKMPAAPDGKTRTIVRRGHRQGPEMGIIRMVAKISGFNPSVTLDDVAAAYRLFLRRPPEADGLASYGNRVASGMSIERLISTFMASEEFRSHRGPETVPVDLGGYSVVTDGRDAELLADRDPEPIVRRIVAARFREGQTFVDIGAGIGCVGFLAARIAGPTGRVVAVEPNPALIQRLYAGIALNEFGNVDVLPLAASEGRATYSLDEGAYAQSVALDDALAYLPAIDCVKLDVGGAETDCLKGFSRLIREHNPILIAKFRPVSLAATGHDPLELLDTLFSLYNRLTVVSDQDATADFYDSHALISHWRRSYDDLTAAGIVGDGDLHFDLIATNRQH